MPKPPAAYTTRRRWTAVDARAALSTLSASGLTPPEFAAREGLQPQRLRRWQRQLDGGAVSAGATPPEFVELRPQVPERVEVVLRSGRVLHVAESIDTRALVRLVEALERS